MREEGHRKRDSLLTQFDLFTAWFGPNQRRVALYFKHKCRSILFEGGIVKECDRNPRGQAKAIEQTIPYQPVVDVINISTH